MPLYTMFLNVTASTPDRSPLSVEIEPSLPWIDFISIRIGSGGANNAGVRLFDRTGSQFLPAPGSKGGTPEAWLRGENETIEWDEHYRLFGPPYRLRMDAFNTTAGSVIVVARVHLTDRPLRLLLEEQIEALNRLTERLTGPISPLAPLETPRVAAPQSLHGGDSRG